LKYGDPLAKLAFDCPRATFTLRKAKHLPCHGHAAQECSFHSRHVAPVAAKPQPQVFVVQTSKLEGIFSEGKAPAVGLGLLRIQIEPPFLLPKIGLVQ
jgi:hypothetical protein